MRLPGTFNFGYNNDLVPLSAFTAAKSKEKEKHSEIATDLNDEKSKQTKHKDKPMAEPPKNVQAVKQAATTNGDTPAFTAEQNAMLVKMKTEEKKTWREIATALGKEVGEVKERWKEVRPDKQSNESAVGDATKKDESKPQEANKKEKRKSNKNTNEDDGPILLIPDENFSSEEVRLNGSIYSFDHGDTDMYISFKCSPICLARSLRSCGVVLLMRSGRRPIAKSILSISEPKSPARMID